MASIRDMRGKYQVRWRVAGRMRSKSFKRLTDARKFANRVEADMAAGDYIDPRAGLVTFGDYAERWLLLRSNLAVSTLERDRSYLKTLILPTFGERSVGAITASDIEAWFTALRRAPSTDPRALQMVRKILDLALRDSAIRANPAAGVKPPTKAIRTMPGRALTDNESTTLIAAAEEVDPRTAAMIWVGLRAGLRPGEIRGLHVSDVDLAGGTLRIQRQLDKKLHVRPVKNYSEVGEGRTIPMSPDLTERLRRHISERTVASIDGYLFVTRTGKPIAYANWRRDSWLPTVELASIGPLRPYDMRHTAATRLFVADRWTPPEVQVFMGHSNPITALKIYTHVNQDALPAPSVLSQPIAL